MTVLLLASNFDLRTNTRVVLLPQEACQLTVTNPRLPRDFLSLNDGQFNGRTAKSSLLTTRRWRQEWQRRRRSLATLLAASVYLASIFETRYGADLQSWTSRKYWNEWRMHGRPPMIKLCIKKWPARCTRSSSYSRKSGNLNKLLWVSTKEPLKF